MKMYKYLLTLSALLLLMGCNHLLSDPEMFAGSYYAEGYNKKNDIRYIPSYSFKIIPTRNNQVNMTGYFGYNPSNIIAYVENSHLIINDTLMYYRQDHVFLETTYTYKYVLKKAILVDEELRIETNYEIVVNDPSLMEPYSMGIYEDTIVAHRREVKE